MREKKRVLVFPCGSEIGLEVYRAVKYSKDFELIGASSTHDHGEYVYENYIDGIPFVDAENFIEEINKIIKQENISHIIPGHDSVALKLAQHANEIKAKIITSSLKACEICRSKRKTYEHFKEIINVPKIYERVEITEADFPIFLKPDVGQGSKGTYKINNFKDLDYYYNSNDQLLLEYLPNDEYTIDCFTNYKGELLYCAGRKRNRISNGISVSSIEIKDDRFLEIAKKINENLVMNGAWFFQVKENKEKELVLLEIATRIAGTMEYQRAFGVNLPLLSLYNSEELNVSIVKNDYMVNMDRALSAKYKINYNYNYVYVDLDDVIIVDGKVNNELLSFLYQQLNNGKKIKLITRHINNPLDTLEKYKIYNFFDEIIHIVDKTPKSNYIKHKDAIFIDDSHAERRDVSINCHIPVFDVNMIDVIIK